VAKRRRKQDDGYPGWVWMLFGLGIGLTVAIVVYFRDVPGPGPMRATSSPEPAPVVEAKRTPPALDDNGETEPEPTEGKRFDFYEVLKDMEVEIDVPSPTATRDTAPQAVVEQGTYILQAGSFSRRDDAENRRGELGLQGIPSRIVRARPNGAVRYRVYIGPISDLDRLNLLRRQLHEAKIDVLRITVDK